MNRGLYSRWFVSIYTYFRSFNNVFCANYPVFKNVFHPLQRGLGRPGLHGRSACLHPLRAEWVQYKKRLLYDLNKS